MLQAIGLSKRYEAGQVALDGLDFEIPAGTVFCLLGANGAGKTTTIHLFLDLIEPSAGRALVDGIDVAREPLLAKERVAYVSENVRLYEALSARENLRFFAALAGRRRDAEEIERMLERVGLEKRFHRRRVEAFSKGMRQKLGLAVALSKGAGNLLLDEPTSGLDPSAAGEFTRLIRDLRSEGKAILMSTHDLFCARAVADAVGVMRAGRLVALLSAGDLEGLDLERVCLDLLEA